MRNLILTAGLVAAMALPMAAQPSAASAASCQSRKTTGTILGGVGGALLGNAVSHGGGGAVIGGLGGAVVGHEIGRSGCAHRSYQSRRSYRHGAPVRPARQVYYDQYGRPYSR